MKKFFCITCHKLTKPLQMTVSYLSSFENNYLIIHVDKKSDLDDFLFLESTNVLLLKERIDVKWGEITLTQAVILLLKKSLDIEFDYLFLLSGDDLPCVSNQSINHFLHSINYKNMVDYQDTRSNYVDPIPRVKYSYPSYFFCKNQTLINKIKIKIFNKINFLFINPMYKKAIDSGIVFYKGTNWFSLNYQTVLEMISFIDSNKWFVDLYDKTFISDEIFFHTLLKFIGVDDFYHDSSKKNDALRYIDWESGPEYPKVLDDSDIPKIKVSGCLFARKFSDNINDDMLNHLIDANE